MSKTRPLRVLHILDTLGGGGSERLVLDIVRLSDQTRVKHRVVTIFPDGFFDPFVYAEPLRKLGAYGKTQPGNLTAPDAVISKTFPDGIDSSLTERDVARSAPRQFARPVVSLGRKLPAGLKRPLVWVLNTASSWWQQIRRVAASYFPSSLQILQEFFRFRPDIVHTHGFYSFKYGLVFRRLFRRPTVHMVPAMFSQMEAQGTGWLADRYRSFHRLVACFELNPGYRSELLRVGVPVEKFFDITGTLDLEALARVRAESARHRAELRTRLRIPADALVALSVGRFDPSKGHAFTAEALPLILKQHPNLHWVLLGEGAGRVELEAQIKALGVEQHAHLVGFDPDPFPYYAAADVYMRTTTMEAENTSSQQAIAMGLPTVGFDTYRETDLIAKLGHGILVPNADVAALAAATCEILSLPDHGRAMGELGVAYCNAHLGIQKHVDDLLVVYAALRERTELSPEQPAGMITDR